MGITGCLGDLCRQLPSHVDGICLEVIPKAEIPQHFKEAMMPSSHTNIFQIIRSYALLCRGRTLMFALGLHNEENCKRKLLFACWTDVAKKCMASQYNVAVPVP